MGDCEFYAGHDQATAFNVLYDGGGYFTIVLY